jgi:hypothetical protein
VNFKRYFHNFKEFLGNFKEFAGVFGNLKNFSGFFMIYTNSAMKCFTTKPIYNSPKN